MNQLPSPGLARRLAAIVYDSLLILPMIMVAVAIATGIAVAVTGDPGEDYSATLSPAVVQLLSVACIVGFYGCFWRLKGQTLGMQAWRIRLRGFDGEPVGYGQVVLRLIGALLSLLPLGAGFLWCLVDRNHRYWHDYLSRTELELLPRRASAADSEGSTPPEEH